MFNLLDVMMTPSPDGFETDRFSMIEIYGRLARSAILRRAWEEDRNNFLVAAHTVLGTSISENDVGEPWRQLASSEYVDRIMETGTTTDESIYSLYQHLHSGYDENSESPEEDLANNAARWAEILTYEDRERDEDREELIRFLMIGAGTEEEEIKTVEQVTQCVDLKEYTHLLGWTKSLVAKASRKPTAGSGEIATTTIGEWDDATSLAKLEVAQGDLMRTAQFVEGSLPAYERREIDEGGRGPLVIVSDRSGSMMNTVKTAMALELSLAQSLKSENRDVASVAFNSSGVLEHVWGSGVASVMDREGVLQHHITEDAQLVYMSRGAYGGSHIDGAISSAITLANRYKGNADILIITDGAVIMGDRMRRSLESHRKTGCRVYLVGIGVDPRTRAFGDNNIDASAIIGETFKTEEVGKVIAGLASPEEKSLSL